MNDIKKIFETIVNNADEVSYNSKSSMWVLLSLGWCFTIKIRSSSNLNVASLVIYVRRPDEPSAEDNIVYAKDLHMSHDYIRLAADIICNREQRLRTNSMLAEVDAAIKAAVK